MKKIYIIFSMLISTIASGQYIFRYDVDFNLNFASGPSVYSNRMYYTTQYNPTPRVIADFDMDRQGSFKTVKGQLSIPAVEGRIKQLWIVTSKERRAFFGFRSLCTGKISLYEDSTSMAPVFDLSSAALDWGCLSFGSTINQKLFRCDVEASPIRLVANDDNIRVFNITPNPNHGNFTVKIELKEKGDVHLRLMNSNNAMVVDDRKEIGSNQYTLLYNLPLAPGVYFLKLETSEGINQVQKIVVY